MAPRDSQALIATGFNRHWPDESNARNLVLRRQEILNDITDTTASVFLGLSLGCARCHDHKYDPLTQMDYYRFQAFFAASEPTETIAIAGLDPEASRAQFQEWEQATAPIRQEMESIEDPVRRRMQKDTIDKFVPEVQEALSVEASARSPLQSQLANLAETHMDITTDAMVGKMSKDDRDRWTKLRDSLKELDRLKPAGSGVAMTVHDVGRTAPPTYLLRRGLYNAPEEEVAPGFPSYFDTTPASVPARADEATSTGRRTVLADWIADSRNPFTTRVVVNRLWQGHFGRGIVGTPSDFGKQGDQPTHPDLLDWLATELVDQGWSLKAMHRLLVTSNTYRQTSQVVDGQERAREIDPDNMMLWRMNRQRLDAEVIRDTMLSVSGTINFEAGGPSIHPELPAGLSDRYGWKPSEQIDQRHRRSIYVFVRRNLRYPLFELFDMPDTNETCGRRSRTTTPPQALFILNSDLVLNYAKAFAGRILREAGNDPYLAITTAYRIAFGRDPCDEEIASSSEFLRRQADLVREQADSVSKLALPSPMPEGYDPCSGAALTDLCHVLLNANEFVYVD